jgi:hypothetical protein
MIKDTKTINSSCPEHLGDQVHFVEAVGGTHAESRLDAREGHPANFIVVQSTINIV